MLTISRRAAARPPRRAGSAAHLTTRRPPMPSQTTPVLRSVRQVAWVVHDVPAAVRFWRDSLGARLLFEPPGMAFFDVGGLRVMLSRPEKPEFDHKNSVLYFGVDDIRAAHAELSGRGVPFVDQPH